MVIELLGLAIFLALCFVVYYKVKVVNAKDEEVEEILRQRLDKKYGSGAADEDGGAPKSRAERRRLEREKKQQEDEDRANEDSDDG